MKKYDIVGIDMPNVDLAVNMVKFPRPNGGEPIRRLSWQGGGKIASGIVASARFGAKCAIIGAVGDDLYGDFCRDDFIRHGIDVSSLYSRKDRSTGLAVVLSDEESMGRSICFRAGTAEMVREDELDGELLRNCKILYVAMFNDLTARAISIARAAGAKILADADYYQENLRRMIPEIDVFIGSENIYHTLFGERDDLEACCREIREKGPEIVVFTFGEKGCAGFSDDGFFRIPAFHVHAVDTVGAGDVYHGAYAAALVKGFSAEKAARYASAVAAIKCTRIGGRAGIPDFATLERFLSTGEIDYGEIDRRVKFYENPFDNQSKK
ncbi:MAG: carbohydrate kinase family protein [Clostridia bacterium]|nr:carbohydrate kinase family protein [Clostridia bacterium]